MQIIDMEYLRMGESRSGAAIKPDFYYRVVLDNI